MKQQDLVWISIPYSSLEQSKVRPAVIVSNDSYNDKSQDIVVCAVTSKLDGMPYSILIDTSNLSIGKLPVKSRIRADKIMQIEKNLVIRQFAQLNKKTFDLLTSEIVKLIQRKK